LQVGDRFGWPVYDQGKPRLLRCLCQSEGDEARRAAKLARIDGLTDRERSIDFALLAQTSQNRDAQNATRAAVQHRLGPRGFLVFSGSPGVGKTTLAICAVNDARARGYAAVYETGEALLRYLRAAFGPDSTVSFDDRWSLLANATVLVLDELALDNTPWAMRQLEELIDIRWRRIDDALTIVCTNQRIESFPPKVASRLGDARVLRPSLGSTDYRRWNCNGEKS
jgi:DNA replication protein DnaC